MHTVDEHPVAVRTKRPAEHHLEVFGTPDVFLKLREDWRDLQQRDSRCRVFQTHAWLSHMYELDPGHRASLQVATVRDGEGRLMALAPMLIDRRMGPIGVRVMRFLGRGLGDYQDILLADDADREAVVPKLSGWFQRSMRKLDRIELLKLPDGSHLWEHRDRLMPDGFNHWKAEAQTYDQTRYVRIQGTFDDYLNSLSKPTRKNYRRYSKRLSESHAVQWRVITRSDDAQGVLDDLVRLHQQRQNERGQRGMFRTPERVDVFTRLFKSMLDEGTLKLYVLVVNGRAYNIDLVMHFNHAMTVYNGGMDSLPEVACHSPGFLGICWIIERAHLDPRVSIVDLGQGDEDYKSHFAKQTRLLHKLRWSKPNLRCRLDDWFHECHGLLQQHPWARRTYAALKGISRT